MATFITSKAVGETLSIRAYNGTGNYWKYYHNGVYSNPYINQHENVNIPVVNADGEFTLFPCDSEGNISTSGRGIYHVVLSSGGDWDYTDTIPGNKITSFDGTSLPNLVTLNLSKNLLTQSSVTGISNLTRLEFNKNPLLTSFDGTGLSSLDWLELRLNPLLTSFDGTGLSSLTGLNMEYSQLTGFNGTGMSNLTYLDLKNNQLTGFVGTVLSNVTFLNLSNNLLTGFNGTGMSSLSQLHLDNNLLTGFNGTGMSSLTELILHHNKLTSFNGTGLINLTTLYLMDNPLLTSFIGGDMSKITTLDFTNYMGETYAGWDINTLTSFDATGLTGLTTLKLGNNTSLTSTSFNNSILDLLNSNSVNGGTFHSSSGRTSTGTADYNSLISKGWTLIGVDLVTSPTFITSKEVGETLSIRVYSNTNYWKYNHNGVYSNVYQNQNVNVNIPVVNADGEFTLLPCDSEGDINGEIYAVSLSSGYGNPGNEVTSFDGSSLNLTDLDLSKNLLTSFSVTGMSNLTSLRLYDNLLTSFSGVGLDSLNFLELSKNPLTSFIGTGLSNLENLWLDDCKLLTSFNGTGLVNLTYLTLHYYVSYDQSSGLPLPSSLTSFIGGDMSKIITLDFTYWTNNSLTSFDATGLTGLTTLKLGNNTSLTSTSFNNSILALLNSNGVNSGTFHSSKGRTSTGTADYNSLINKGWTLTGLDLSEVPEAVPGVARTGIRG